MTAQNAQSFGCFSADQKWTISDRLLPQIDVKYTLQNLKLHSRLTSCLKEGPRMIILLNTF